MTIEELVAQNGGKYVDSSASLTGTEADNYAYIVVNEDAVFSALVDLEDNNVLTEWGIASKTITKGMVIAPQSKSTFKTITLTSGSVLAIRG